MSPNATRFDAAIARFDAANAEDPNPVRLCRGSVARREFTT
ncbi:MAG: hypothetical protein V3U27_03815 [Candidatus Tectomicrobia bacterium]